MDVAGSAVGIASLGIQICQGLCAYYDGWKEYHSDISSTLSSVVDLSKTLTLLKASLDGEELDTERSERVKRCLQSSEEGLIKLSKKAQKLRTYGEPQSFRQKAWTELQRTYYPFRAGTLTRLREIVGDIQERLNLAVQVLQLDISTRLRETLTLVDARTQVIEASVDKVSAQNQRLLDAQEKDQFQDIVSWLSPPDPWTNHASACQLREPQTGTWLLRSDQYREWKTGPRSHLWLYGKAGCGKTVLCSTLIEDIRVHCETSSNSAFAIFYFSFSDDQKQSYGNLLRSLVAQCGWRAPARSMLLQAYGKPNRSLPGLDELENILAASLQSCDTAFLLFDALDECPQRDDHLQHVLEGIERLSQRVPEVRILVTSRELFDVRRSMEMLKAEQIPIAIRAVDSDISKYLSSELSRNWRLGKLDLDTKELIKKTISQNAHGMFRWAYCQLHELKKLKSLKPKYVKEALLSLPPTLDETYKRMLNGIEEMFREEALTLLRWLAYARSPLSLHELAEAAIINPTADVVDVDNRGALEDTLEILAGLVTVDRVYEQDSEDSSSDEHSSDSNLIHPGQRIEGAKKVRFAHFSVQEYLESKRISQSIVKEFYLEYARGHRYLAQSCLTYMLHYSNSSKKRSTEQDLINFPLLKYAARSWFYHSYRQGPGEASREISLLISENTRRDWLRWHRPDRSWVGQFDSDENTGSGLYYASLTGLKTAAEGLLTAGVDINAQGGGYGDALRAASVIGHEQIVQLLLHEGADVNAQGGGYGNALCTATASGHEQIVRLLLDKGADVNAHGGLFSNALCTASFEGLEQIVQLLLNKGADVNAQGGLYGNALCEASSAGHEYIVQLLLNKGADVNAQGRDGNALRVASAGGYEHIVQLLLNKGADVNAQGRDGNALYAASAEGHERIVQLLLNKGADVNAQGMDGNALCVASARGHDHIVQLLTLHGGPQGDLSTLYN